MSSLTVLSCTRTDASPLTPAPNVHEATYIATLVNKDTSPLVTDLMAGPLTVLANHRGSLLYCAGGVTVYRINPTGMGGYGYSSLPLAGAEEDVSITCQMGGFYARVRFE